MCACRFRTPLLANGREISSLAAPPNVGTALAIRVRMLVRTAAKLVATGFLLTTASGILSGCSAQTGEDTDESAAEVTMSSPKKTAYNFFVSKGLKNFQAAGVVGNLLQESSLDPKAYEYGGGPGRGIAQWSVNGRWVSLKSYAAKHGVSPWALTTQLDFIWYELQNGGYGLSELQASTNVTQATIVFQNKYEICGSCAQSTRLAYAKQVLADYGSGGGGGSSSASCYSGTLGKSVPNNTCVESKFDSVWYQCDNGSWVDRWSDPEPCASVHPL